MGWEKERPYLFNDEHIKAYGKSPRLGREANWFASGVTVDCGATLTFSRFILQLERQEYRCAICGKSIDEHAHADHDHATGEFRGVLCAKCNALLGKAEDNIAILLAAIEYLKHNNSTDCEEE